MKRKRRYSNFTDLTLLGAEIGAGLAANEYNSGQLPTGGSSGSGSGSGSSGSAWSSSDTSNLITSLADTAGSVLQSIFGKNNQYQAQAYSTMYNQEKRTNTILWVVIGLIVALGIFLVIRKTK